MRKIIAWTTLVMDDSTEMDILINVMLTLKDWQPWGTLIVRENNYHQVMVKYSREITK